ncbi:MAG: hypothetical protein ACLR06_16145 [Christensenellaceae bacterium]
MKIAEIINRFFPIAVGKEIGNNNRKPVAVAEIGTALDRGFEIGLLGKLRVFQLADCAEKSVFPTIVPNGSSERFSRMSL